MFIMGDHNLLVYHIRKTMEHRLKILSKSLLLFLSHSNNVKTILMVQ